MKKKHTEIFYQKSSSSNNNNDKQTTIKEVRFLTTKFPEKFQELKKKKKKIEKKCMRE